MADTEPKEAALTLHLAGIEDPETSERVIAALKAELLDLPVRATPSGVVTPPPGAKASPFSALGTVGLSMLPAALPLFFKFLTDFLERHGQNSAKLGNYLLD